MLLSVNLIYLNVWVNDKTNEECVKKNTHQEPQIGHGGVTLHARRDESELLVSLLDLLDLLVVFPHGYAPFFVFSDGVLCLNTPKSFWKTHLSHWLKSSPYSMLGVCSPPRAFPPSWKIKQSIRLENLKVSWKKKTYTATPYDSVCIKKERGKSRDKNKVWFDFDSASPEFLLGFMS